MRIYYEIIMSWDSDWLRVGRPKDRSSSPGRVKNFLFSMSSIPALGSTQAPIQYVQGERRLGREADHSPPGQENMDLYIHPPHTPSRRGA
jgi:hypothetical protein